jgi:hypothetical protein
MGHLPRCASHMADILKAHECHSDLASRIHQSSASPVGQGVGEQCWELQLAAQVVLQRGAQGYASE